MSGVNDKLLNGAGVAQLLANYYDEQEDLIDRLDAADADIAAYKLSNDASVANKVTKPSTNGTAGQVLALDNNGNTQWIDNTSAISISPSVTQENGNAVATITIDGQSTVIYSQKPPEATTPANLTINSQSYNGTTAVNLTISCAETESHYIICLDKDDWDSSAHTQTVTTDTGNNSLSVDTSTVISAEPCLDLAAAESANVTNAMMCNSWNLIQSVAATANGVTFTASSNPTHDLFVKIHCSNIDVATVSNS